MLVAAALAALLVPAAMASAQSHGAHQEMNARGAEAMGFDQEKTTHHFRLYPDGGAIEVVVRDAADAASLEAIRAHLPHIAHSFGEGDFALPHFIHATDVPGTVDLARLRSRVTYRYEAQDRGGRVRIVTADAEALAALHAFLRFQIQDHRTGDSLEVTRPPA
ncbi:MAG: hypothetical protein Q8L86_04550 [Vicinamibacterales bacterium]|nr:hypothetical protein [Vicinamibacterales bacterium]